MHIKEHFKSCPKCKSDAIQFDKKHFVCSNCGFDLYINASAAVAVLITNQQGELLLTVRKFDPFKGTYDLPGGFVDINETVEDAAIREIKEELNLDIISLEYFCSFPNTYTYKEVDYYTLDMVFKAQIKDFSPLQANDDVSSIEFISPKKIDTTTIGLTSIKAIVSKYIESVR
ncbi:NUDIX domain-containing protein [Flammeovirga sp. OC4]|uniref:NUDIX hydrolase n=1 Tax=Flammeovirga sp. OC4 TaxID=1382345 RepID=UPI0005C48EAA|nr:NUDIX domain-containing protein [Flammeovirga sp. OC4]